MAERRRSRFPGFDQIEPNREVIVALVREREKQGLSQTVVAARMGTSQSAVARLEAGDADVRLSTLHRYAAAVGRDLQFKLGKGPTA
ncbi:MAG TPA: helix-turn-helix transcriptional regulator [Acidimicrobiales bacterium]|nr:helix-turn-helix transcriptional regulator [Acidimicrobiales bacterium]